MRNLFLQLVSGMLHTYYIEYTLLGFSFARYNLETEFLLVFIKKLPDLRSVDPPFNPSNLATMPLPSPSLPAKSLI